jgi:hypothetical protein
MPDGRRPPITAGQRRCDVLEPRTTSGTPHLTVSNGPTENLNLKIKNTKRIARGYRNFDHYCLRFHRQDQSPTRIRTRAPRFAA